MIKAGLRKKASARNDPHDFERAARSERSNEQSGDRPARPAPPERAPKERAMEKAQREPRHETQHEPQRDTRSRDAAVENDDAHFVFADDDGK